MKIPDSTAPRTLIADDQPDVLDALRLLLKGEGYQIEAVNSPAAVIETLTQRDFDVLLMDLNYARDTTSGQEGLELLPRIQAIDSTLPIVVMTAWSNVPLAVEAMRRGVSDFVEKPWENSRLLHTLRTQVERARLERHRRFLEQLEREDTQDTGRGLLPRCPPRVPGYDFACSSRPVGGVGGDYFDIRELDASKLALAIGDVIGKGVPAALLMSNLQAAVRAFAGPETPTDQLCEKVNQVISNNLSTGKFITFFYCLLDVRTGLLQYTNAGHAAPIVTRADGTVLRLAGNGAALGLAGTLTYEQHAVQLRPGDTVIWFTDGITEATNRNDEEFSEDRLIQVMLGAKSLGTQELHRRILEAVSEFSAGKFQDDATLIVMSVQ